MEIENLVDDRVEDFQVMTELLGPFDDLGTAMDAMANHVSTALLIEAQHFGRSPVSVSHDVLKMEDGLYVTVVEVTQPGLLPPTPDQLARALNR